METMEEKNVFSNLINFRIPYLNTLPYFSFFLEDSYWQFSYHPFLCSSWNNQILKLKHLLKCTNKYIWIAMRSIKMKFIKSIESYPKTRKKEVISG